MTRLVRAGLMIGLTAVLVLTGCDRRVEGRAAVGSRDADPAYFFAGEIALFGQTVSPNDKTELAYLRALRRIDVCGLLNKNALSKVGEIISVSTLFAFSECDIDLKLPTSSSRKLLAVELMMTNHPGDAVAFRVGDTPVYQDPPDCQYLVPLPLSRLPGGAPLRKPQQPFVRIGLIAQDDCAVVQRVASAVAQRLSTGPLPARDGAAVYPALLAERDPCAVLGVLGDQVDHWDISTAQPHQCQFGFWRTGLDQVLSVQLQLEPQVVESVAEGGERLQRDGVEVYLDRTFCSAVSFVGAPMQRRVIGGDFVALNNNVEVRPAVAVESGGDNCDAVADVAARAAKLYS